MVLDALSPQRRRLVLAIASLVLLLITVIVVTTLIRSRSSSISPATQSEPGPVILVPGYGGSVDSLRPLADAVRSTGRTAIVMSLVGDGRGDLRVQATRLGEVADQARRRTGAPSVDVIGFSAGGVVARLWVKDDRGDSVARRVLTIGSPHHGTSQAALGAGLAGSCPEACQQLDPDSDLLRRLNAGDETPDGPLWATIRTTADRVVTPVDSAALDGALNVVVQDLCPASTTSHGELVRDPVVLATLNSTLGTGPPREPTEVNC